MILLVGESGLDGLLDEVFFAPPKIFLKKLIFVIYILR